MGLLDSVLGAALGAGQKAGQQQGDAGLGGLGGALLGQLLSGGNQQQGASALLSVINMFGGVQGIVGKLTQAGLGAQVQSWIGTGANAPVTGDQISGALGSDMLGKAAGMLGVDASQASGMLAMALPAVVNALTPKGQMPQQQESASLDAGSLMGMLGGLLGKG